MPPVASDRIGTTVRGKWVLERLLGVGGMASVYVGRHKIGRLEAIKILHADIAKSDQIRARFEQEAMAVNAFRHPGVVEIRDVDVTDDGAPFLVMELLDGESLGDRIKREPRLSETELARIAAEVLDVLFAAHALAIVHRDIKPDNVFLQSDGRIKVLDFGIARMRSGLGRALPTQAGVTLGTMAYMPPEQARGQEIDARADLYAVGATMFRVLAGRIVHGATTDGELVMKALSDAAPRLGAVAPQVSAHLAAVVDRALAYDREDRYADAKVMRGDLLAILEGKSPPYASSAPPLPERAPSSFAFAPSSGKSSVAEATFVPQAKRADRGPADAAASSVHSAPTRIGRAPEVASTRLLAEVPIPPSALPSIARPSPPAFRPSDAAPAPELPRQPPAARPTVVSSQSDVAPPSARAADREDARRPSRVSLTLAVAVVSIVLVVALAFGFASSAHDDEKSGVEASGQSGPTPAYAPTKPLKAPPPPKARKPKDD